MVKLIVGLLQGFVEERVATEYLQLVLVRLCIRGALIESGLAID